MKENKISIAKQYVLRTNTQDAFFSCMQNFNNIHTSKKIKNFQNENK